MKVVKVSNGGTSALTIQSVALTGTNPGQFKRTRKCPATLAAGATCSVEVVFAPTSPGAKSAKLVVSTGAGGVSKSVALSGTGL